MAVRPILHFNRDGIRDQFAEAFDALDPDTQTVMSTLVQLAAKRREGHELRRHIVKRVTMLGATATSPARLDIHFDTEAMIMNTLQVTTLREAREAEYGPLVKMRRAVGAYASGED